MQQLTPYHKNKNFPPHGAGTFSALSGDATTTTRRRRRRRTPRTNQTGKTPTSVIKLIQPLEKAEQEEERGLQKHPVTATPQHEISAGTPREPLPSHYSSRTHCPEEKAAMNCPLNKRGPTKNFQTVTHANNKQTHTTPPFGTFGQPFIDNSGQSGGKRERKSSGLFSRTRHSESLVRRLSLCRYLQHTSVGEGERELPLIR